MGAPSPGQVDEKAEQYYRLKAALDEATKTRSSRRKIPFASWDHVKK